jgi:hypothetical protein
MAVSGPRKLAKVQLRLRQAGIQTTGDPITGAEAYISCRIEGGIVPPDVEIEGAALLTLSR